MKLRIAAAAAIGVVVIGILAWPLAARSGPFGATHAVDVGLGGGVALIVLAFSVGLAGYFVSWPYGREIGILAAPSGLAIWAVRSGTMAGLMQRTAATQRQELFATIKWEPLFWLAIVAAGFAGVLLAQKISGRKVKPAQNENKSNSKVNMYLNVAVALVGSVLIAQFCITILARNVRIFDDHRFVVAQPATAQVVFAVLVSFGLAAFVVKAFLNVSYIWPAIASALVTAFTITIYLKQHVLQHLVEYHPAAFFPNAVIAILPVQMVAFGTLGSIAGYWMAVRYNYWRKHA
jgi:hypothetical protein